MGCRAISSRAFKFMASCLCCETFFTVVTEVVGESEYLRGHQHSRVLMQVDAGRNAFPTEKMVFLLSVTVLLLIASLFGMLWCLHSGYNQVPGGLATDTGTRARGCCFGSENFGMLHPTWKTLKKFAVRMASKTWDILEMLIITVIVLILMILLLGLFLNERHDDATSSETDTDTAVPPTGNARESIMPSECSSCASRPAV